MSDFEEIYNKYALTVKKYIISLGADESLSEDITAETFYRALKNINSYDESKGKVLTWLCTIAKNLYFNHLKKKENQTVSLDENETELVSPVLSIEKQAENNDEKIIIYRALMELDYPYKDVIYLRIFADLSFREIGNIFSKNENWARVTFYRGKLKLKGRIENEI